MWSLGMLAVVVVPIFIQANAYEDDDCASEGCDPSVFCGSQEANGYCGNPQHCVAVKQWFHNVRTGKCETFDYYGQGGNYNRFTSKERCERTCTGYSNSYKYENLCQKCPNPVHIDVNFNFEDLVENGFFCNGDDCQCPLGKKCCPVLYNVTYTTRRRTIVEKMNGYSCLPSVVGECEKPEESCNEHTRSHSSKRSYEPSTRRSSRSSSRRSSRSLSRSSSRSSSRRSSRPSTKESYKISTQGK